MKCAKVTEYALYEKNLPIEFDGYKIAHISDPHSHPAKGVSQAIAENEPDIIVITGDLLDEKTEDYSEITHLISNLSEISPVYAVTGNHDLWRANHKKVIIDLEGYGIKFLRNEMTELTKNGEKIALFGIDDPFSKLPDIIEKKVKNSYDSLPAYDGFKILLFHRANLFDCVKDLGFDLILSGHMHGGQIRLPILGGVCGPTSAVLSKSGMLFPKYTAGIYNHKNTSMLVNRGIGNTLPIPRFGNPPEVGIITLHTQKADTL